MWAATLFSCHVVVTVSNVVPVIPKAASTREVWSPMVRDIACSLTMFAIEKIEQWFNAMKSDYGNLLKCRKRGGGVGGFGCGVFAAYKIIRTCVGTIIQVCWHTKCTVFYVLDQINDNL